MCMVLHSATNAIHLNVALVSAGCFTAVYRLAFGRDDLHLRKPVVVDAETSVYARHTIVTVA